MLRSFKSVRELLQFMCIICVWLTHIAGLDLNPWREWKAQYQIHMKWIERKNVCLGMISKSATNKTDFVKSKENSS